MRLAPRMIVALVFAVVAASCLTALAAHDTSAYFSDTVSGIMTGTIGQMQSQSFNVTATAGPGGSATPATQTANLGDTATVTITPHSGYHVATLLVDSVAVSPSGVVVFSQVNADHAVAVTFAINTFNVTATAGPGGSVSPASQTVNLGDTATVTVTPSTGYRIATITVDGIPAPAASPVVFTNVTSGHAVAATFAIDSYTLAYTAGPGGSIVGSSTQVVTHGADGAPVTASPAVGYHFVGWSDGYSTAPRQDKGVTASLSARATFAIDTFTVSATAGPGGAVSVTNSNPNYGDTSSVLIAPNAGYHIATLIVDAVSVPATSNVVFGSVTSNHTVSATFAVNPASVATTYTITAFAGPGGSVSPTSQSVNSGDNATVTITPNAGYHVATVLVDGSPASASSPVVFTGVNSSHTVAVTFAPNAVNPVATFTVTAFAGANGTATPAAQSVNSGDNATVTIAPNAGYHIATLLVDSVSVTPTGTVVFTNVTAAHTVSATFAANVKATTTITIESSRYTVLSGDTFILDGRLTTGSKGDPVVVEVVRPGSGRWSYSSTRACYQTLGASGHWWYRYTGQTDCVYRFRVRFLGDATRNACMSRTIIVTVNRRHPRRCKAPALLFASAGVNRLLGPLAAREPAALWGVTLR